jgi:hypothetical protein
MKEIAIIKRYGEEIARIDIHTELRVELLNWFHRHSSYSMSYLMRYCGYSYEIVEVENNLPENT